MIKQKILITLVIINLVSCISLPKKDKVFIKEIKLKEINSEAKLVVVNDIVKIYLDSELFLRVIERGGISNDEKELLNYVDNTDNPEIRLVDDFNITNTQQDVLYPILWDMILKGRIKLFELKSNSYLTKIKYVKINDFSGEQEYFATMDGERFLIRNRTLGE